MSEFTYQAFYWLNEVSRLPYPARENVLAALHRVIVGEFGEVAIEAYPLLITAHRIRRAWESTGIPLPVADNPVSAAMLAEAPG